MKLPQIITSLLEQDLYKYSMQQAIYHQFPGYKATWSFKCRNEDVRFAREMVYEIIDQIQAYCALRFTEEELEYLDTIPWIKGSYIDFLRLWRPNFSDFTITRDNPCGLSIETAGTWLNTSMYEIPVLAIVNEVYFRMSPQFTAKDGTTVQASYEELLESFKSNLDMKYDKIATGRWYAGTFSEFGLRRRLSAEAQDLVVRDLRNI